MPLLYARLLLPLDAAMLQAETDFAAADVAACSSTRFDYALFHTLD